MLAAWFHDIGPYVFPGLGIRWYGVSYLLGFVVAWFLLLKLARRRLVLIPHERVDTLIMAVIIGVIAGGRLGYVLFYRPSLLWTGVDGFPWWGLLAINEGGMASHGGILGVILACLWYARREKIPFLHIGDVAAALAPFGLLFGRLANFINGELLGVVIAQPGQPAPWWTVKFPQELVERPTPTQQLQVLDIAADFDGPTTSSDAAATWLLHAIHDGHRAIARAVEPIVSARAPSQLLQGLMEGVVVLAAVWWIWRKPRRPGVVGCWFLIVYGAGRVLTEFWRLPDDHLAVGRPWGLSRGQWLSVAMVAAGAALLWWVLTQCRREAGGGWGRREAPATESATDE